MLDGINVLLSSDALLSFILLFLLSMLGLKLMPFNFSPLREHFIRRIWTDFILGSPRQSLLERAVSAFYHYEHLSLIELKQMQRSYAKISRAHKRIGYEIGYPAKLERLAEVARSNAKLTSIIAKRTLEVSNLNVDDLGGATSNVLREVREALRHFIRDWSAEGQKERDVIMNPILDVLRRVSPEHRRDLKVLVPGSGLGRLAWEISQLGFVTFANELSPFMNICFEFIVSPNHTQSTWQYTLHPYAQWFSHQSSNANLFRIVSFPDVLPRLSDTLRHLPFDFLHLAPEGGPDKADGYDYVVTQFFIDTSYNIITTLEQIHRLLKPGGMWINLGPLLWRNGAQAALELSLEEVLLLAEKIGLAVDEQSRKTVECEYTADTEAMMRWVYKSEFWVAVKR